MQKTTTCDWLQELQHHLGTKLIITGMGALVVQLTSHNPLLAIGLGLGVLVATHLIDRALSRRELRRASPPVWRVARASA